MAMTSLTREEIELLVDQTDEPAGFVYPPSGMQPYYDWLIQTLHRLGRAASGHLRVYLDDAGATTIGITPGRLMLDGIALEVPVQTVDLAAYNNDTAYVWIENIGGQATLGSGADGDGWPSATHLKLAQVELQAGAIVNVVDRRIDGLFRAGVDPSWASRLATYHLDLITQGNTASPSTVRISLADALGQPLAMVNHLRVRVCDEADYGPATNATIAPGSQTTNVETITAGKDLVLASHTDGQFHLELTNPTAETVTLRIGAAPVSSLPADHTTALDVTHA